MSKQTYRPKKKIPGWLQPTLWSVKVDNLGLEEDRVYIINQVLAYGGWRDFKWLFANYPQRTVKKTFLEHPIKTYRPATFNFAKKILFDLEKVKLIKEKYVVNTPRIIR